MKITYEKPQVVGVSWADVRKGEVSSILNGDKNAVYLKSDSGLGVRLYDGLTFPSASMQNHKFIVHENAEVILK